MSLRGLFSEFYGTYTYKLNTLLVSLCSKKNNNNNTVKPCFMDARLIPTRGYFGFQVTGMIEGSMLAERSLTMRHETSASRKIKGFF